MARGPPSPVAEGVGQREAEARGVDLEEELRDIGDQASQPPERLRRQKVP
jgi:hypothetical protein